MKGKHSKKRECKNEHKSKKNILISILQLIFLSVFIYSSVQIIKWYKDNKETNSLKKELTESISVDTNKESEEEKYNIDFESLKEKNKDTVAFLKVNDTNVEYVVVKSNDNKYYLNHSFDRKYNIAGWIFADYKNKFDGTDKNIVVYGHNRRDGSMFGSLKKALKEEWYKKEENRKIVFIIENESCIYEVFSIYQIEKEDYYIRTNFSKDEFADFIKTIKSRSINDFGVEVSEKDSILTLSTCANDNRYRVVIHAKKIVEN